MSGLKTRLRQGAVTIGSWVQLGHPALVEMLAGGPFDWLTIDREHTSISVREMGELIRIIDLAGSTPFVRLSGHSAGEIKKVLDAGARGVIAPNVNTVEQATAIASACRYPPAGTRGVGLARAQKYGVGFPAYRDTIEDELLVIAQIEHIDGVRNLEGILAVEGIDGFFVGPYDLSASLGRPGEFDHPDVVAALDTIASTVGRQGVLAGIHVVEPDLSKLARAVDDGYRFIALASDMLFFSHYLTDLTAGVESARGKGAPS